MITGDGDLCRCFTCDGGLKDWSSDDDPCKEHAKYFPNCEYMNQLKGKEYVEALQRERQTSAAEVGRLHWSQNNITLKTILCRLCVQLCQKSFTLNDINETRRILYKIIRVLLIHLYFFLLVFVEEKCIWLTKVYS